ncbi:MAG TPA: hypothetical protein VFC93_09095 [Chloroflexota bacterium]|nr:hypothetical protein [Chloroflexota bacterium]
MNRDGLCPGHIRDAIDRIEQHESVGRELFLRLLDELQSGT